MSSAQSPDPQATVSLSDEEGVKEILFTTILGMWELVNNLTRIRPPRRERYRIAIFGSSRAKPGSVTYEEVERMAASFARMGCDIVTGGGPGLMQAANEGAMSVGCPDRSTGIRIDLPFEQGVNPFVGQAFEHKTFFTRLHHFVIASDAFVVVPGGIGTVLETFMVWQLLQVRHVTNVPLVLVGTMWPGLVQWATQHMLDPRWPLASLEDMRIPVCLETGDEAIAYMSKVHAEWLRQAPAPAR